MKLTDVGLLVLRVGLGGFYVFVHGGPKFFGGPELWGKVGMAMGSVGIHFAPVFWGFMAAFSEFFGGICLVLGLAFRPACGLLIITMAVAAAMHLQRGDTLTVASHALENAMVLLGLLFMGPGRYGISELCSRKK